MLALIAGEGGLPPVLVASLRARGQPDPVICQMDGFTPDLPADMTRIPFRFETLGSLFVDLRAMGVDQICMAGRVRRPVIDESAIDVATAPLMARLGAALGLGDDGTLREIIAIMQEAGFSICAAHDIAPELLPPSGVLSRAQPNVRQINDAIRGEEIVAAMGRADTGQACVIRASEVLAREGLEGTDAMIAPARGAILFKAPKPDQDRRVDLPTIGPNTLMLATKAGFSAVVIESGGVIVLDQPRCVAIADASGLVFWVREREAA